MKIVINQCYGGFSVSKEVFKELDIEYDGFGYLDNEDFDINSSNLNAYRAEPKLIKAIEKLGVEKSSDALADLYIVNIPDNIDWYISEYDGMEEVQEVHRSWS